MRFSTFRSFLFCLPAFFFLFSLAACGGGGGGGSAPAVGTSTETRVVTRYFASGRIAATGTEVTATSARIGHWTEYHDQDGSPKCREGTYTQDALDQASYWCEWNADGSIRSDQTDQ